ncbi:MAG: hypothetical protein AB7F74_10285 [Parvibaculaceae bacterium]
MFAFWVGAMRGVIFCIFALLLSAGLSVAFFETPFTAEKYMQVNKFELAAALELALKEHPAVREIVPRVFCDVRVARDKAVRNAPGCAIMSQVFSDINIYSRQGFSFTNELKDANYLVLSYSEQEMSEFVSKIRPWKIGLFAEFSSTPEYKIFSDSCLLVNFKEHPQKYLVILSEKIDSLVAYDCMTLGALFYLSYPSVLLREKYLPTGHRSFYLTGIELAVLCMRNEGIPKFDSFSVTSANSEAWTWKQDGNAAYIGCDPKN